MPHSSTVIDSRWFADTLADRQLSQRQLAKMMGVDPASMHRLFTGKRAMRLDEADRLAVFLGVGVDEVLKHAGIGIEGMTARTYIVGYVDGNHEAHIDWNAREEFIPTPADVPPSTVAVQHHTAMTPLEAIDGWTLFVEPPVHGDISRALNRFSLVSMDTGLTMLGFLRRGYKPGAYNLHNLAFRPLENMKPVWAVPVLWIKT